MLETKNKLKPGEEDGGVGEIGGGGETGRASNGLLAKLKKKTILVSIKTTSHQSPCT